MAEAWIAAAPLLPALVALALGSRMLVGERWREDTMSGAALAALGLATLAAIGGLVSALVHGAHDVVLGTWLRSGTYVVDLALRVDVPGAVFAAFALTITTIAAWYAKAYMHREPGFTRLYALLCLFGAGMALLGLAGNAVLAFVGWEIGGVCSALLIAFWPERRTSVDGGVRALVTNRPGDAAYLVAIAALVVGGGGVAFGGLEDRLAAGPPWVAIVVASCVLIAAAGKAGLVPFTPWVGRAIEGPTPTSALFYGSVMLDAGVFLAVRFTPAFVRVPGVQIAAVVLGVVTTLYGVVVALAQSDAKAIVVHRSVAVTGLAFALIGLGLPGVGLAVALVLGTLTSLQMILVPSLLEARRLRPVTPVSERLRARPGLQLAAADRFWLEACHDTLIGAPVLALAEAAERVERGVIEDVTGAARPSVEALGSVLAGIQQRERPDPTDLIDPVDRGVFGRLTGRVARGADRVEEVVIVRWLGDVLPAAARSTGALLERVEPWLEHTRFLIVLVVVTILAVAIGGPA